MRNGYLSILIFVLGGAVSTSASQVAFNNFTGGDGYDVSRSYIFAGPNALGVDIDNGVGFNAQASGPVETITAPLALFGGSNRFQLRIYDDNNGLPGQVLYSTGPLNGLLAFPTGGAPLSVDIGGAVRLEEGERYYVVASASGNTEAVWFYSSRNNGTAVSSTGGGFGVGSMRAGALRVTVVPEPTSLLLLGLGGLLLRRS